MDNEQKVILLNEQGLNLLNSNASHAIYYFNQALLKSRCFPECSTKQKLLAMTFNNLGCYYNATNQLEKAFQHFEKSAQLGHLKGSDSKSTAFAHLNLAGLLSKQDQHEKALRHALKSIHYLKLNPDPANNLTLITAYQVLAMEYFTLDQKIDSKVCLETALALARRNLGRKHAKYTELFEFYSANFKEQSKSIVRNRAGSVITQRNLTPSNAKNRAIKSRLVSYMSVVANSTLPTPNKTIQEKLKKKPRFVLKASDMQHIRKIEHFAAVRIQAWWKGALCRDRMKELLIHKSIKKAEIRAQNALDDLEKLKSRLLKGSTRATSSVDESSSSEIFISKKIVKS